MAAGVTGKLLQTMFASGAAAIANEFAYIDQLNVFPIPDGDTGTNMKLSATGALPYVVDTKSVATTAKQFARGLLMNARGNSGVIFSQVMSGFAKALDQVDSIDDAQKAIAAFENATVMAYKSVMAPVEGTMLTVIRVASEKLRASAGKLKNAKEVFALAAKQAYDTLQETPNMLKQLKDAGVVDSGGYGLWRFLDGMSLALQGSPIAMNGAVSQAAQESGVVRANQAAMAQGELGYGYCCEFIITLKGDQVKNFNDKEFDGMMAQVGESTVTVRDEEIVKVHTHTLNPGQLLSAAQKYGEFSSIKIDNMSLQAERHLIFTDVQTASLNGAPEAGAEKPNGKAKRALRAQGISLIVTVPTRKIGERLVRDYGVSNYIDRSREGNPSTTVFMDAVAKTPHRNVIIAVDDGNIVMAAEAAAKEFKDSKDRHVRVVPSRSIVQAMAAALVFNPLSKPYRNYLSMRRAARTIEAVSIGISVKNIRYGKLYVRKNDLIALHGKEVVKASRNPSEILIESADYLIERCPQSQVIQVVTGKGHDPADILLLKEHVAKNDRQLRVEVVDGDQDLYMYILGM